jgi:hypothetical protein
MKIKVARSGGFAGVEEQLGEVDTQRLSVDQSQRIQALLAEATDLQAGADEPVGADFLQYDLTLEDTTAASNHLRLVDDGDTGRPAVRLIHALLLAIGSGLGD